MHTKFIYSAVLLLCMGSQLCLLAQPATIDKIIAKVNQHIVLKSELEEQFLGAQSQGASLSQCELLESIVHNKVLVSKAELDSIPISEEQVEANLEQRLSYVVAQVGSEAKVKELYGKSVRQLKEELREAVRNQILIQQMRSTLIGSIKASPREVRAFFEATPEEDRPYYSAEVRLGQIVCKPSSSKQSEEEVRERLLSIRQRLLRGEDFEALARRYSEDPSASQNGGRLGFFRRGELDPAYEASALRLEPGDLSLPVRSDFGYHIIQLMEVKGNTYDSQHILLTPKITEDDIRLMRVYLDSIRNDILSKRASFEQTAKDVSEDPRTAYNGGFFEGKDGGPFISVEDIDPLLFFVLDTMQVGTISRPMTFTAGDGSTRLRLLYYKKKIRPHQADFSIDYLKLQAATLRKKQEEDIQKWLRAAYQDLFIFIDPEYSRCDIYKVANKSRK